jgi:hypothetical protein
MSRAITMGTIYELGLALAESFPKLSPAEQERLRKEMYEQATGKPYRPESSTPKEGES